MDNQVKLCRLCQAKVDAAASKSKLRLNIGSPLVAEAEAAAEKARRAYFNSPPMPSLDSRKKSKWGVIYRGLVRCWRNVRSKCYGN